MHPEGSKACERAGRNVLEKQLRDLDLSSLEKRRLRNNLIALENFLRNAGGEGGVELLSLASRDWTCGIGSKLYQERFRLDSGSISLLRGYQISGGFLERWPMPQACQCSGGIWTISLRT